MPAHGVKKAIRKKPSAMRSTSARLSPAARNRIIGMSMVGASRPEMCANVRKTDGHPPTVRAVTAVVAHFKEDPEWDGSDSSSGGRPRNITPSEEKQILL
jgi:hypothetical protein